MLRMGKLTDYGIVLMSYLASKTYQQHSAHNLSDAVQMPLPTVRKVLKSLSQAGLLKSERGAQGGYNLTRNPKSISIAEIITAIEGPIALTECVSDENHCEQESHCSVQTNWTRINNAVFHALDEVKLSDMLVPQLSGVSPIHFYPSATLQNGELHG
ncbi:MAG: SUF system Fe-S cluster assembly regulator [Gammaproteobacteria bacterium]|nr:MAG: SUF system Fe-S cluster assembly regulator [Gammaproteobacteria bacterium]RKZ95191.1 MAG: SUF system Fe-S cluster assembly regulator [Gammaproteobacteria bacterium]RKZ95652.1 MAG: SUF system Fe-S cluster assembly regulator [Gammaproteobacteria bacterium]